MKTTFFRPSVSWYPILSHVCTTRHLFPLGSLELKTHMVCLGGHMLTLEKKVFAGGLFWSPLGWVSVTCSKWFRQKQCLWLNSRAGEFGDGFKLSAHNLILLQQHHKLCCQCYTENGNHVLVEIPPPSFLSGATQSVLRRKHLGRLGKLGDILEQSRDASVLDEEKWKLLQKVKNWILTFKFKAPLQPCMIKQCQTSTRELSGQHESFPNMALRQKPTVVSCDVPYTVCAAWIKGRSRKWRKSPARGVKDMLVLQTLMTLS